MDADDLVLNHHAAQVVGADEEVNIKLDRPSLALVGSLLADDHMHSSSAFRISGCAVHHSGAMLLEDNRSERLSLSLEPMSHDDGSCPYAEGFELDDDDDDDDDDDGGEGIEMSNEYEDDAPTMETVDEAAPDADEDANAAANDAAAAPEDVPDAVEMAEEAVEEEEEEEEDLWAPLDPHASTKSQNKPFRKAVTYRAPKVMMAPSASDDGPIQQEQRMQREGALNCLSSDGMQWVLSMRPIAAAAAAQQDEEEEGEEASGRCKSVRWLYIDDCNR
jgi:hypothetical protein